MTSEMQERIARAIESASKDCDDPDVYYQVAALAAMKAMREPTPEMKKIGEQYTGFPVSIWRVMLDAEITIAEGGKDG